MQGLMTAWGRILAGYAPALSIEITRECPLRCPGCYAFGDEHLGGGATLRDLTDFKGDELVRRTVALVDEHKPIHVSIVGGEPLVRYREVSQILPALSARGIWVQVVTSAVRPIPREWASIPRLKVVVSIDGLAPEHDVRRAPATYDRILKHIEGQAITVHCTVTRQQAERDGYLREFLRFWSNVPEARQIWMSLYTPQLGEESAEKIPPLLRRRIVDELMALRTQFPKLDMPRGLIQSYAAPPHSPDTCIFAQTTTSFSADLRSKITPCQFGGKPDCANCGCVASAALAAVARHRLRGGIRVGAIFEASVKVGQTVRRWRQGRAPASTPQEA
ncbi:MAG: radical SAM protein [Vicinamibacterales bacterium]